MATLCNGLCKVVLRQGQQHFEYFYHIYYVLREGHFLPPKWHQIWKWFINFAIYPKHSKKSRSVLKDRTVSSKTDLDFCGYFWWRNLSYILINTLFMKKVKFSCLWDRLCSIFNDAGKFCLAHGLKTAHMQRWNWHLGPVVQNFVVVVFYVHSKHLRSCRDNQLT